MLLNFLIIQTAPGGPVERFLAQINQANKASSEISGAAQVVDFSAANQTLQYQGASGVDEELIRKIEKLYGFDLPLYQRFFLMIKKFLVFDFGESFYQNRQIIDLVLEKMPTSISLGIFTTLLVYLISIPLGIKKAVSDGSKFDITSSSIIIFLHAIPAFLFAILLIILFCGGNFLNIFPLRGLTSANFDELSFFGKIFDYLHHLTLPIIAMTIGGFASLTFFVKNSFIEEINKNYVLAAKARGLNEKQVLYRHVFRNAILIVIAGMPAALVGIFFTSSMLIEVIFSLDGLGLMGYEATLSRDFPVIFASLYFFTLLGLVTNLITDLTYRLIDPRINFDSK
jgi:microcin C transport system permease protein